MERSAKFISLHGLSGVMAGIYALVGAYYAYHIIYQTGIGSLNREYDTINEALIIKISAVA